MIATVTLKVLGSCSISCDGTPVTDLPNKALALLVYLAMTKKPQRRTYIAGLLWSELDESSALANLRKTVHGIRATDPAGEHSIISVERQTLSLSSQPTVSVDAIQFESALDEELISEVDLLSSTALYGGEFLAGFYLRGAQGFSNWQSTVQSELHHKYIFALSRLSSLYEQKGNLEQAIYTGQKLLALEPLREDLYLRQMQLYNSTGQRSDAIKLYHYCEDVLQTELATRPAPQLSEFYKELQNTSSSIHPKQVDALPATDTQTPPNQNEHKFIIGPPVGNPANFFGRNNHLTRIFGWWQQPPFGHVALIGPRRSGKTSLLQHLEPISGDCAIDTRRNQKCQWLQQAPEYHWVTINFQDPRMRTLNSLLRHLLNGFRMDTPKHCTLEVFMELATEKPWTTPTIILIDELEAGLAATELEQSFWWTLRSLTQMTDGFIGIAMATHEQPMKAADAADKTSPFFNLFSTLEVGAFEVFEAQEFINSIDPKFRDNDKQWILEQSGCWPCLLQILCQEHYFSLKHKLGSNKWRENALRQIERYAYLPR